MTIERLPVDSDLSQCSLYWAMGLLTNANALDAPLHEIELAVHPYWKAYAEAARHWCYGPKSGLQVVVDPSLPDGAWELRHGDRAIRSEGA